MGPFTSRRSFLRSVASGIGLLAYGALIERSLASSSPPAFIQMHTGVSNAPRPSMGAWVLYGLGAENGNLPGFVTISPPRNVGGAINYGSAFLPATYQGTKIGGGRQPIARARVSNLNNPVRTRSAQHEQLDFVRALHDSAKQVRPKDPPTGQPDGCSRTGVPHAGRVATGD